MNTTWSRRILIGTVIAVCLLGIGALEVLSERVSVDGQLAAVSRLAEDRTQPAWDSPAAPSELTAPEADLTPGVDGLLLAVPRKMTDSVQKGRLTVLEVDGQARRLVSLNAAGRVVVGEVEDKAVVVTDDRKGADLTLLKPGDVIRVEPGGGPVQKIVVLRHGWDEVSSPEQ
ncbi:MAG TPA: hypothetical protein VJX92_06480 [Methylomirabilota bacterium]|nr:hypothetical protein [Methylomirabilota bacterium]